MRMGAGAKNDHEELSSVTVAKAVNPTGRRRR
jgi:hypothetical protein